MNRTIVTAAAMFLAIVLATGCSLSGKRRGAKLSDAVEQAKRDPDEKRPPVHVDPDVEQDEAEVDTVFVEHSDDVVLDMEYYDSSAPPVSHESTIGTESRPITEESNSKWHFGVIAGIGYQSGDDFNRYGLFGINAGHHDYTESIHVDFGVIIATVQPKPGSETAGAIKDQLEASFDVNVRYYLTPSHTFSGIYVFGGGRYGIMGWDWANPIEVSTGGGSTETIDSDLLGVFSLFAGMGLSVAQTKYFKLGVNVSGGFKLYHDTTLEGFDNDVFGNAGIVQIMFPITFGDFSP